MTTRAASIFLIVLLAACGGHSDSIAELTKADGPVERQAGQGAWGGAKVGTKFVLGDAARTADGGAELKLTGGGATIQMHANTVLRFGNGKHGGNKIGVEIGAIELSGDGSYQLGLKDLKLEKGGRVLITAKGNDEAIFDLQVGSGVVERENGEMINLTLGQPLDLTLALGGPTVGDAGVADAVVPADAAAPPDAAAAETSAAITIDVVGKKAEIQLGTDPWKPLDAGAGTFPTGAKLRLGAGTTATLVALGTTLKLAGGSRMSANDKLIFSLEAGDADAIVPANATGEVDVPGGAVNLKGAPDAPGDTHFGVNGKETKLNVLRGTANVVATIGGGALPMTRGEGASLERNGTIHPTEAIPSYFDFRVAVGDTLTVHDPRPPTAVQFQFQGKCPNGGVIEMDHDTRFRTAKISAGKDSANLSVGGGSWAYRLRCSQGDNEGAPVASGRIAVTRDDGHRALPKGDSLDKFDADGRRYTISYQSTIPNMEITYKGTGSAFKLHLAQGGKEQTFDSAKPVVSIPGKSLHEGSYTYWFDHDGVKQEKVSTLKIDFDQTAAQVYIESPNNGQPFVPPIDVRGAALAGWSASVEGTPLPLDRARRFTAKVDAPPGNALAIRLAHDKLGVHYYLRRQK